MCHNQPSWQFPLTALGIQDCPRLLSFLLATIDSRWLMGEVFNEKSRIRIVRKCSSDQAAINLHKRWKHSNVTRSRCQQQVLSPIISQELPGLAYLLRENLRGYNRCNTRYTRIHEHALPSTASQRTCWSVAIICVSLWQLWNTRGCIVEGIIITILRVAWPH